MPNLDGVFIPVTTPFRGEDVAPERLQANLQKWNATALAGYVVLGSTGEFPMLSEAERDRILVAAREAIPKTKAFIAGTGTNSTLHTIRQSRRAAEVGADAAIVITPHYFTKGFSQGAAQVRHYLAVADASPIPIMIYNFPLNTGINLEAETVAKIAQHPNVCGIKDSSGDRKSTRLNSSHQIISYAVFCLKKKKKKNYHKKTTNTKKEKAKLNNHKIKQNTKTTFKNEHNDNANRTHHCKDAQRQQMYHCNN